MNWENTKINGNSVLKTVYNGKIAYIDSLSTNEKYPYRLFYNEKLLGIYKSANEAEKSFNRLVK